MRVHLKALTCRLVWEGNSVDAPCSTRNIYHSYYECEDASLQWVIQTNFPMRIFLDMNLGPYQYLLKTWMQNRQEYFVTIKIKLAYSIFTTVFRNAIVGTHAELCPEI